MAALLAITAGTGPSAVVAAPNAANGSASVTSETHGSQHSASGFEYIKGLLNLGVCAYDGGFFSTYYVHDDCVRIYTQITGTETGTPVVTYELIGPAGGAPFLTLSAARLSSEPTGWLGESSIDATWPSGRITVRVKVAGDPDPAGLGSFYVNALGASVRAVAPAAGDRYEPGEAIPVEGDIYELNDVGGNTTQTGVAAEFSLQVRHPDGTTPPVIGPVTAASDGTFTSSVPGSATSGLTAGPAEDFQLTIGIDVVDATWDGNLVFGPFAGDPAGSGAVTLHVVPTDLVLENKFVSSKGWVKPGESYPFRVLIKNATNAARSNLQVTIPAPPSVTFQEVKALQGTAGIAANTVTWTIASLAAGNDTGPTVATLVVQAKAAGLGADPEVVWKDLSSTATLTYTGGPGGGIDAESRGPKVVPPGIEFNTARYGDKPFPMVPVDYTDRKHDLAHNGEQLSRVVNSPDFPGSTYSLYQEMSYGQLHPFGSVPSVGIASRGFEYGPGFGFTQRPVDPADPTPTCRGATLGGLDLLYGSPAYPERIHDGWYQLPGDTEYYGGDFPAFTLGVGSTIDGACGNTSKSVYDAAVIADPEIDYSDYDSDKDGVVDFFMMVFVGLGGNGASQLEGVPPYDNIWPHSSSLEFAYQDPVTGLSGYISDDQLKSLSGVPQCYTNPSRASFTDCAADGGTGNDALPVQVRVGPYNVNPESAIDKTSVIAHEYGHHLGMPDYYSTGYSAYNDWNLMAGDYSQHMTIFSKQELGWVVPNYLDPGEEVTVSNWKEIKSDTGRIRWQRPDGTFYVLSAANGDQNIHNGQAYALKMARRLLIDPQKVANQASAPFLWHSGRGNDFGCTPIKGHNLDVALPELENVADGTPITVTYKSSWDIEWDFDYGFTMVTTNGADYTSLPSANGYTTPSTLNPNNSGCLDAHDNGLTGLSGSYQAGTETVDRNPASPNYGAGSPFLEDEYDLSAYAGQRGVVLRFSYFTDPGFDRPGWFIDDLKIMAGTQVLYQTDFTAEDDLHLVNGGCAPGGRQTGETCTAGWDRIKSDSPSSQDHAYYLELRDRAGFDFNGRGQSDRGEIGWAPGALIEYTDEIRGYGNTGGGMPPRQHYIDSQPQPGLDCGDNLYEENPPDVLTAPRCQDAAFTAAAGDRHFDDDPNGGLDPGDWVDNFADETSADGLWHFDHKCLTLDILSMSGNTGNSEALPADLTASATITAGIGCDTFDYGRAGAVNNKPEAVAQAQPNPGISNWRVVLDGSRSSDDQVAPNKLSYAWDLDNNGSFERTGMTVLKYWEIPAVYTVRLKVTDPQGASAITSLSIRIRPARDFIVTNVRFENIGTGASKRVKIIATVKNNGFVYADTSRTQFLLDGTTVLGNVNTHWLKSKESVDVSVTWDARGRPGDHTVKVIADKPNTVPETYENNNTRSRHFRIVNGHVE